MIFFKLLLECRLFFAESGSITSIHFVDFSYVC